MTWFCVVGLHDAAIKRCQKSTTNNSQLPERRPEVAMLHSCLFLYAHSSNILENYVWVVVVVGGGLLLLENLNPMCLSVRPNASLI